MLLLTLLVLSSAAFAQTENIALTGQQEQKWRAEIRRTLFVPDPLPDLDAKTHGQFEPVRGVIAERVTYASQFGLRIPAILYLPKARTHKLPALIVVNGHGGDKFSWYAFYSGILYAQAGAAVLTYDPAAEGERNVDRKSGTRGHDKVEPPKELAQRLAGLMITDVMQAVSYLASREEIDSSRIAAAGYSMGSFVLSLTCSVDLRLKACVLAGGGNLDGPEGYWDKSKPMCQGTPYRSLAFLGDRAAAIYSLHASRGATLVYNGLEDTTVGIPQNNHREDFFEGLQQRVAKMRGKREGLFEFGFAPKVAHRPHFVTKPVALWLQKQLNFPKWTVESIRSMPEIQISKWARAQGVDLDPLYATEEREGGTPALDAAIHAPSRQALSIFSPGEWQRQKGWMIHETWLERAKSQLRAQAKSISLIPLMQDAEKAHKPLAHARGSARLPLPD